MTLVKQFFTNGTHPFELVEWEKRTAKIDDSQGEIVFQQEGVEFPDFWSQQATDIVTSKYFRGQLGTRSRETSLKQVISRVTDTIAGWGFDGGYFESEQEKEIFRLELAHVLLHQMVAFNSPVWFNMGMIQNPQCSACFILSVEDQMPSILEWYRTEGIIFKGGSGSGINLSHLRSSKEPLSQGGWASGPVSFMHGADSVANVIRSGGATRRAAKMVVLNADHPDILDFIWCKARIQEMAQDLKATGRWNSSLDGKLFSIYTTLPYQNANNSVRVTDAFMEAVKQNGDWELKAVTTGQTLETVKARWLWQEIAKAAWQCADPGLQFHSTINAWHTCPNNGKIEASNPCSEYMHLSDSACNLASINLLKFLNEQEEFEIESFKHIVDVIILAMEIIVGRSSYPTEKITQNAMAFRQLGLGYSNLGATLMVLGLPYDSDAGRTYAAALTALLCGEAYRQSALIAQKMGPFAGFAKNREAMLAVIEQHGLCASSLNPDYVSLHLYTEACQVWQNALDIGKEHGFRNSQTTVIAPTGTISFMMDCDTTGVEPDLALVKTKKLVGGGQIQIVNQSVPRALRNLGYQSSEIEFILSYLQEKKTIEGAPGLKEGHLSIFDCSFKPANGQRAIQYMGHVLMMAAVQPFISGAISKTVNMPAGVTVKDVANIYLESWERGLKAVAIYRDGCKSEQPLSATGNQSIAGSKVLDRRRLPPTRSAINHKFSVGGHEGYINVGLFEDGSPGEVFIKIAKEGSTVSGLMDVIAIQTSLDLQFGIPLRNLVGKFKDTRFEPMGITHNPEIKFASSIVDYIFRWLGLQFLTEEEKQELNLIPSNPNHTPETIVLLPGETPAKNALSITGPPCDRCGGIMVQAGSCWACPHCGATSGCS